MNLQNGRTPNQASVFPPCFELPMAWPFLSQPLGDEPGVCIEYNQ